MANITHGSLGAPFSLSSEVLGVHQCKIQTVRPHDPAMSANSVRLVLVFLYAIIS